MSINNLVARLGAKREGTGWKARCPAHEDTHPSLSIAEGRDGRVLLKCHAGCSNEAVVRELGIEFRDLFADNGNHPSIVAEYDYTDEQGTVLYQVVRFA